MYTIETDFEMGPDILKFKLFWISSTFCDVFFVAIFENSMLFISLCNVYITLMDICLDTLCCCGMIEVVMKNIMVVSDFNAGSNSCWQL